MHNQQFNIMEHTYILQIKEDENGKLIRSAYMKNGQLHIVLNNGMVHNWNCPEELIGFTQTSYTVRENGRIKVYSNLGYVIDSF